MNSCKRLIFVLVLVSGANASATVKPSLCATLLQNIKQTWHTLNSWRMQERKPIGQQHLAKRCTSDHQVAKLWLTRDRARTRPYRSFDTSVMDWEIDFVLSVPDWKSLTNAQLRSLEVINGFYNEMSVEGGREWLERELKERLFYTEAELALWSKSFPDRPLPLPEST